MATRYFPRRPCPDVELHHPDAPRLRADWAVWAAEMRTTHVQRRCPGCGRWVVWTAQVAPAVNDYDLELLG